MGREARIRKQHVSRSIASTAPKPVVNIAERRSLRDPLQPNRKTGVFIAIPTVSGKLHFTAAMTFANALASSPLPECPFNFTVHIEAGKRPIDYARNCIVRTFLRDTDADWLLMIDDDQVIPDNFWHLCTVRDADVVAGISPVWVANMDAECMLRVNNYGVDAEHRCYNLPAPDDSVKQPYRVPIAGTGAIAIRRRVFAPKPHGVGETPFYFTYMDDRKVRGGEDVNFSVECNRAGFVVAAHPGVRLGHVKEIPLEQIETFYRARKAMEASGKQSTDEQRLSIG